MAPIDADVWFASEGAWQTRGITAGPDREIRTQANLIDGWLQVWVDRVGWMVGPQDIERVRWLGVDREDPSPLPWWQSADARDADVFEAPGKLLGEHVKVIVKDHWLHMLDGYTFLSFPLLRVAAVAWHS